MCDSRGEVCLGVMCALLEKCAGPGMYFGRVEADDLAKPRVAFEIAFVVQELVFVFNSL